MSLEKKIYREWAFTGNESEKASINREIYKELCESTKFQDMKWKTRMIMTSY